MKNWQITLYALIGAFFIGGIIFSVTHTFTSASPFGWLILLLIMLVIFLILLMLLSSYRKHRPSLKNMEDKD